MEASFSKERSDDEELLPAATQTCGDPTEFYFINVTSMFKELCSDLTIGCALEL